ncbi:unnamed protein product [Rhizophagus irregularis]|nr:unnamed protein product [Rhizophagus irregularis]
MNYSDSKSFYLGEVLLWKIIYYIVCVNGSDIDRRKFCKYGWDNLFRGSIVAKEYEGEHKLVIDIFQNRERTKK